MAHKPPRTHEQLWRAACASSAECRPHRLPKLRRPKARRYMAKGGPYDGKALALVDGTTALFRVTLNGKTFSGRYQVGLVNTNDRGMPGTTHWRDA